MPRKLFRCSADSAPRVVAVGLLAEAVFFPCVVTGVLHVSDSTSKGTFSSSGLGDLPVVAAVSRTFLTPWSPTLGAALVAVLPTGNASCGLGNGQTAAGMDLGVGVSPGRAHLSADASRSVSGVSAQSSITAPKATTLRFEGGYDVSPRWTWTASVGVDVGSADSTQALSRVIGVGVRHTLVAPLMVTVRSEEHTSELQSPYDLVCRLLLEKKNEGAAHRA